MGNENQDCRRDWETVLQAMEVVAEMTMKIKSEGEGLRGRRKWEEVGIFGLLSI